MDVITALAPTVHHVEGPAAGWAVLTDAPPGPGVAFTLVDAGYPGYAARVRDSVRRLGLRMDDLAAVVVTHAHVDHVGALPELLAGREVPVLTGADEVAHLRGEVHESAGPADVAPRLLQHGVLGWTAHLVRNGALGPVAVPGAAGAAYDAPLDVPGHPVPLATPGHTSGHTCYVLPEHGAVLTGDALVTGHPLSRLAGPQVLRDFFHHDPAAMLASLELVAETGAEHLLPGHGPVWRGSAGDAADQAALRAEPALRGRR